MRRDRGSSAARWSRRGLIAAGGAAALTAVVILGIAVFFQSSAGGSSGLAIRGMEPVEGADATLRRAEAHATPTPEPTPAVPPLGDARFRLVVEKIGVDAPVSTFGLDENSIPEVPTGPDAAEIVAWYDFSARPGTGGNAVLAGHVTWNGPAVFRDLATLQPGDSVRVRGENGVELLYTVTDNFMADPNDPDSVKLMLATERDMITLITCGGAYTRTNDPVFGGQYDLRVVVQADLVSVLDAGSGD